MLSLFVVVFVVMRTCRNKFILQYYADGILYPVIKSYFISCFGSVYSCVLKWSVINKFSGKKFFFFFFDFGLCIWLAMMMMVLDFLYFLVIWVVNKSFLVVLGGLKTAIQT
jgi:hypothetical protein